MHIPCSPEVRAICPDPDCRTRCKHDLIPTNYAEFVRRFAAHHRITGKGLGNVRVHAPCPFCAAADFMVWEILETEAAMAKGATCADCGRSAKTIINRTVLGTAFEIVQTGGPDAPEWLPQTIRRVDSGPAERR